MDSLTHIALGACIGEAVLGKKLGKKAMVWGALAQSLPDIDFIASAWLDTDSNLLAHRGFTHSILFACIMAFVLALIAERWHRPHNISLRKWFLFFSLEIGIHIFIDAFNNYGVGWFEPFSHSRISFNAIYVADLFFSIGPGIAFLFLVWLRRHHPKRKFWWRLGIGMSIFYLAYCCINKSRIDRDTRQILAQQHIPYTRYFTTPAPLNNWLWFVVAGNDSGYYIGYRSVFDRKKEIAFEYFPRNDSLLQAVQDREALLKLTRFSKQFYTVEQWNDTLVFNDLRFGQIIGWQSPRERFVFHYYLDHPNDNKLVVQRGRFAKWDRASFRALLRRIKGN